MYRYVYLRNIAICISLGRPADPTLERTVPTGEREKGPGREGEGETEKGWTESEVTKRGSWEEGEWHAATNQQTYREFYKIIQKQNIWKNIPMKSIHNKKIIGSHNLKRKHKQQLPRYKR